MLEADGTDHEINRVAESEEDNAVAVVKVVDGTTAESKCAVFGADTTALEVVARKLPAGAGNQMTVGNVAGLAGHYTCREIDMRLAVAKGVAFADIT